MNGITPPPQNLHPFGINGKRSDSSGWCKLFDDQQGGVFGCYRQGIHATWCAQDRRHMTPFERAELARKVAEAAREREIHQRQQWAENARRNLRLWSQCQPLQAGDVATRYLRHRLQAEPGRLPACLRMHTGLDYWHGGERVGTFPALVACITSPAGDVLALHRTYLTPEGRKADVPTVKKLTGASGPLIGGCIRLGEPKAGALGIAEGLETALAASQASGLPVVAAYSAGALAGWTWPEALRSLVIFGDADKAGRESACRLQQRATAASIPVHVMTPATEGADWCDVWAGRDAVQVGQAFDQLHAFEPSHHDHDGGAA